MKNNLNRQFNRVFVTGDIHGDMADLSRRVASIEPKTTKDDLLIILGDCAFFYNCYYLDNQQDFHSKDFERREMAAQLPITIVCIQGNHEQPYSEMKAERVQLLGGEGYFRDGIYFAANGTVLNFGDKNALVVGGAYSVDKEFRLLYGHAHWENEELSDEEFDEIIDENKGKKFDFVFTHTCAFDDLPRHAFLSGIDQSKIKNRTEKALSRIKDNITFSKWYCGHFHIDETYLGINFLYRKIERIL